MNMKVVQSFKGKKNRTFCDDQKGGNLSGKDGLEEPTLHAESAAIAE